MDANDFREKKNSIDTLAAKSNWISQPCDSSVGRVSYIDEQAIFRIDIYTTKMTVCIMPKGEKPIYKKKQSLKMIESIFRNPFKYC